MLRLSEKIVCENIRITTLSATHKRRRKHGLTVWHGLPILSAVTYFLVRMI